MLRATVIAVVGVVSMLAGCLPQPHPQPTLTCEPPGQVNPYPCTQEQHDEVAKVNATYDEAERIYRLYVTELFDLFERRETMSPTMEQLVSGPFAESVRVALADGALAESSQSGHPEIAWIERIYPHHKDGADAQLDLCLNPGDATVTFDDESVPVPSVSGNAYFREENGRLVIFDSSAQEVSSC